MQFIYCDKMLRHIVHPLVAYQEQHSFRSEKVKLQ